MYITTVYDNLTNKQQKKIKNFLKENFGNNGNFEFEPKTIIILYIEDNKILGCICLLDNKFLLAKLNQNNVPLKYYSFNNSHGCFIYNFCVDKNHRNKKIGYNLINYTIEKMFDINIDYLHTQAENEIAMSLFLKNGFMEENNFLSLSNQRVSVMNKFLIN
jgi:ribosomal protein S18 acetylase RimI-like enzyme